MNKFKFIFLSVLGLLLYIMPITLFGTTTILISHFSSLLLSNFVNYVIGFITITFSILIIMTIVSFFITFKKQLLADIFNTTLLQKILRLLGAVLYLVVMTGQGPEFIISADTGGTMFGLINSLFLTFFAGIILMPLITKFGAVEFVGVLVAPFMQKLFKVPGYAAIDATASFVGDGTIGIVVTDEQYQKGYYTQKQAALIATTFSIVGISFAGVVADALGFGDIFGWFYFCIFVTTLILALIMARLPYKKFESKYYKDIKNDGQDEIHVKDNLGVEFDHIKDETDETSTFKHALKLGEAKAAQANVKDEFISALKSIVLVYFTFLPIIMCVGSLGLIIATYTSFFNIISAPLVPLLTVVGFSLENAKMIAPALLVGFTDMYLPTIFIIDSTSEFAKFFVGVMSFSQLLFLSETGMVLVRSKIGFNFVDIVKVFLIRTALAFPIVLLLTKLSQVMGLF